MEAESSKASSTERRLAAAGLAALTAGVGLIWYFEPTKAGFFPPCPLYSVTGFACPGCGLTRGFHALFHGDISAALGFNLFIPVYLLIFAALFVSLFLVVIRGIKFPRWPVSVTAIWSFLVLLLVFGVVRNIPAYPFTLLFP